MTLNISCGIILNMQKLLESALAFKQSTDGYKTYTLVGIAVAVFVGYLFNAIDLETALKILGALGIGSVATIKDAIDRKAS